MSHPLKYLSDSDLTVVAEVARVALADGTIYDAVANELDLSDEELLRIRGEIEEITNGIDIEY